MKCDTCEFNLGEACQASLPGSKLEGCDPFVDDEETCNMDKVKR